MYKSTKSNWHIFLSKIYFKNKTQYKNRKIISQVKKEQFITEQMTMISKD